MTKLEKVITALKVCRWHYVVCEGYWPDDKPNSDGFFIGYVCKDCPYHKTGYGYDSCLKELHEDALELLKAHALYSDALEILKAQRPTVDAVPIVRCKDCKSWDSGNPLCVTGMCKCNANGRYFLPNDFCSDGERREE